MKHRKAPRRKFTPCLLDPEKLAARLHDVMAIGAGTIPTEVVGWFHAGNVRRIRADYPNGWRLSFSITEKGNATRICASLHVVAKGERP